MPVAVEDAAKRNIVLFMPDQLRYDALGCSGNELAKTPHLDAFAKEATLFTNCFVQNSVCTQSRCSIFTGTYPHVSGHRSLNNLLKPYEDNLFKSLKENGYHVACLAPRGDTWSVGATELSVDEYGFLVMPEVALGGSMKKDKDLQETIWSRLFYKGKREGNPTLDYDEACIQGAEEWLASAPPEPWCLLMPLIFPHVPFAAEEPFFSMHNRADMPPPIPLDSLSGYQPRYMEALRKSHGWERATPEIWAEVAATYYGMVSRIDSQFGRIMSALDVHGHKDKTYTAFFTDHGEYLGDYGLVEKWPAGVSDCLTHEPFMLSGPGLPKGQVNESMCEMVDMLPTLFELNGIAEHFPHNGRSLVPTMKSSSGDHKAYAFSEGGFLLEEEPLLEHATFPYDKKAALQHEDVSLVGKVVACRDKEWTYVYRLYEPAELYNRAMDPGERHNLAGLPQHAATEAKMREVTFRWMVETSDCLPWKQDDRFPKVDLLTPRQQLEARRKKQAGMNGAVPVSTHERFTQ